MPPLTVADAAIAVGADLGKFKSDLSAGYKGAEAQAKTAGQRAMAAFSPQNISRAFTAGGAIGGNLFAGAIGGAATFEDQLRTINTVAKLPEETLKGIGDQIVALSGETGKSTDDLTSGFYDLVSAGVPAEEAIGVLRDSAKFATGALGTTAEAVDLVTSAMNAYGLKAGDSTRVTDIFAKAVADGKVTAADLGSSIANIAPIASSAGVSLEEVSSGFALLTAKGVPAAQAATQMRASISALLTPNEALNRIQAQTGINFAELAREQGLAVALEKLRQVTAENGTEFDKFSGDLVEVTKAIQDGKADAGDLTDTIGDWRNELGLTEHEAKKFQDTIGKKGLGDALAELGKQLGVSDQGFAGALGSVEAYQFALATTGENAEAMAGQIVETTNAAGIAQEQYDEKSKSASEQGKRLAASIRGVALQIGGPFVEGLGPAVIALNQVGGGLNGVFAASRLVGSGIGALAGKLIPTLLIQLGLMAPAAAAGGTGIGAAIAGAIPAGMALLPVLLIAALIAAVVFLINNPDILAKIGEVAGNILSALGSFLAALPGLLVDLFVGAISKIIEVAPGLIGAIARFFLALPSRIAAMVPRIVAFFLSIPGRVAPFVGRLVAHVAKVAAEFRANVGRLVGGFVNAILSIPAKAAAWVVNLVRQAGQGAANILTAIRNLVNNVVQFFLSIPGRIASLGGRIASGIINGLTSLPGRLADAIRNAFRNLRIDIGPFHISASGIRIDLPDLKLPSFDVGTGFVPADMLAVVHRGEIIVPEDEASDIRAGRTTLGVGEREPGGPTTVVNASLHLTGMTRHETMADSARMLRRVVTHGIATPKADRRLVPTDA